MEVQISLYEQAKLAIIFPICLNCHSVLLERWGGAGWAFSIFGERHIFFFGCFFIKRLVYYLAYCNLYIKVPIPPKN